MMEDLFGGEVDEDERLIPSDDNIRRIKSVYRWVLQWTVEEGKNFSGKEKVEFMQLITNEMSMQSDH